MCNSLQVFTMVLPKHHNTMVKDPIHFVFILKNNPNCAILAKTIVTMVYFCKEQQLSHINNVYLNRMF